MTDSYLYIIVALMPLSAAMLVFQTNPYHALIIRGVLGAMSALIYAVLGAADVALTEALVGTMLAITLYAVAVRSSMVMRLGILKDYVTDRIKEKDQQKDQPTPEPVLEPAPAEETVVSSTQPSPPFETLLSDLRTVFRRHHMRIELYAYADSEALQQALMDRDVHAICLPTSVLQEAVSAQGDRESLYRKPDWQSEPAPYQTITRLRRLYDIMNAELASSSTTLTLTAVGRSAPTSVSHAIPVSVQPLEEQP
ncbi:MAG: DUF4040 domain-containing protein [Synechococcales cyanobacterium M58_A2018_015]|nr:DUF4040 domain-containing protein [Synechococcales cyanobacterium M58_A2018_015]